MIKVVHDFVLQLFRLSAQKGLRVPACEFEKQLSRELFWSLEF